jgi:L-histidine Nalpha-methyltransferase
MKFIEIFKKDVNQGLSQSNKSLSSKYFYDKKGDALFVEIMKSPEYYLSRAEIEIWKEQSNEILNSLQIKNDSVDIFELGAGDGTKTVELLKVLNGHNYHFKPIDISQNALNLLEKKIKKSIPDIRIDGIKKEYFEALEMIGGDQKKIILFLGSNIGNLTDEQCDKFMRRLGGLMNLEDKLVIGFDLKKSSSIVLPAYNDSKGVTREFNLNLLKRINRELGGNFICSNFEHQPEYDEESGVAKSYLLSLVDQKVYIEALEKSFSFLKGELIHTENSKKFSLEEIDNVAKRQNLRIVERFFDSNHFFTDIVFEKE